MHSSIREFGIHRCQPASDPVSELDRVAVEEPLEIVLSFRRNGVLVRKPISITMRTPGADEALAAGFLFTEGIIQDQGAIESVQRGSENGASVLLRLREEIDLKRLDRHFYASSSCGVCGKTSLEAIKMNRDVRLLPGVPRHDAQFLVRLPEIVRSSQPIFQDTGGLHAAALFDQNEQLIRVCEDIGRHNAVDKVIGAELLAGRSDFSSLFLFVSGRAGFELVQKSIMSGIAFLAAVGAPSSLSVELARRYDATLIGFLRENRFNLYAGLGRIAGATNSQLNWPAQSQPEPRFMNSNPIPTDNFEAQGKPDQAKQPSKEQSLHTETITPGAQPPVETHGTHQGKRREIAAGLPGVEEAVRYAWGRMGIVKGTQALMRVNQKDGFDCQSCAWPDPDGHRSFAEFCENGAKAVSDEGTRKRVTPEFFAQNAIPSLLNRSDHWLNEQGRLTHPMVRREGSFRYEAIRWEDAFALIASELRSLQSPNQAAFYTSGRTSNEAAYLYQLFVRLFGTNNLPDCSNMCHESSGSALSEAIGIGKGTVTLDDFLHTDAIFVVGQNPGTNHPRMLSSLQQAKARGAKLVSVNPLPETGNFRFKNPQYFANPLKAVGTLVGAGTRLSDLWLPIKINGDLAFFKGLMKELLAEERKAPGKVFDLEFINKYTTGYDELIESLERAGWNEIVENSGLSRQQIRQAAEIAMNAKSIICCWAMGLTQHKNAVATIREVANFLLLRGNIGKKGAGACPVRGHSNVQGDRTVGVWDRPTAAFLDKLGARYQFNPPREHGAAVVDTIKGMHQGAIKVFFALGGNFLSATPDTQFTAEALSRCRLTVHVSTKLNRSHLITGRQALVLPCIGRSEIDRQASGNQFVTVEDSMGIINPSRGKFEPASEHLLSEVAIVARLARAVLGETSTLPWEKWASDYSLIRTEIENVIPGFERYNERIAQGTFYLPNAPRDRREFRTQTGKAKFTVNAIEPLPVEPDQYVLTTIRSHDQFNTTIYGLNDRYRGIYNGRRVIFMNRDDMKEAGFVQGQPVDITSHFENVDRRAERFLVAPYSIPRRCVAVYFPEGNVLVPVGYFAEKSKTPVSKSVCVTLAPSSDVAAVGVRIRQEASAAHPLAQAAG